MKNHEAQLRSQFMQLRQAFDSTFPGLRPPELVHWRTWITEYDIPDIMEAIQQLGSHPLKNRFTPESCGKAISAILREKVRARALRVLTDGGSAR